MPARVRKPRPQIGYRYPPDISRKFDDIINDGEFTNRADIISTAIRFWLDHRRFNVRSAVKEFLTSDEGIELLRSLTEKPES